MPTIPAETAAQAVTRSQQSNSTNHVHIDSTVSLPTPPPQLLQPSQLEHALHHPKTKRGSAPESLQPHAQEPCSLCPFLSLSAELRIHIYSLVFLAETEEETQSQHNTPTTIKSKYFLNCMKSPPLARVNRQLRTESLPVFFSATEIHVTLRAVGASPDERYTIDMAPMTRKWLEAEVGINTAIMRKVRLCFDEPTNKEEKSLVLEWSRAMGEGMLHVKHGSVCIRCSNDNASDEKRAKLCELLSSPNCDYHRWAKSYKEMNATKLDLHIQWVSAQQDRYLALLQSQWLDQHGARPAQRRNGISIADIETIVEQLKSVSLEVADRDMTPPWTSIEENIMQKV